jgi:hypothetical protein
VVASLHNSVELLPTKRAMNGFNLDRSSLLRNTMTNDENSQSRFSILLNQTGRQDTRSENIRKRGFPQPKRRRLASYTETSKYTIFQHSKHEFFGFQSLRNFQHSLKGGVSIATNYLCTGELHSSRVMSCKLTTSTLALRAKRFHHLPSNRHDAWGPRSHGGKIVDPPSIIH